MNYSRYQGFPFYYVSILVCKHIIETVIEIYDILLIWWVDPQYPWSQGIGSPIWGSSMKRVNTETPTLVFPNPHLEAGGTNRVNTETPTLIFPNPHLEAGGRCHVGGDQLYVGVRVPGGQGKGVHPLLVVAAQLHSGNFRVTISEVQVPPLAAARETKKSK